MIRFLQMLLAFCFCLEISAIPAKPGLVKFRQPDGRVINISLVGDEHDHLVYSEDGFILVNVGQQLEYARIDADGNMSPSGILAGSASLSSNEVTAIQNPDGMEKYLSRRRAARLSRESAGLYHAKSGSSVSNSSGSAIPLGFGRCESSFPVEGNQKGIVILVEYADVKFEYADSLYFDRMLNEEGFADYGSLGSARDWFMDNSYGRFIPHFDVFGPVVLPNERAYYGKNDKQGNDSHPEMMAVEACRLLDDTVDFSQYDRDSDGVIDNVFVFFAGNGEHDTNITDAVWPHSWDIDEALPDSTFIFDGVRLNHYACSCEVADGYKRPDGIGTFVHEFSHVLGLPDLYVTSYSRGFTPGEWSVLDLGPYNNDGLTPPNYSSFEKFALGWIDLTAVQPGAVSLPDFAESGQAYILPTDSENEYYYFENRQQRGNDTFLPYHGMLVWHVDYNRTKWNDNTVNNSSTHQNVDLIEADNVKTEASRSGDPFPGVRNVTEFTYESTPQLASWNRLPLDVDILNIAETNDGVIKFDVEARQKTKVESIADSEREDIYYDLTGRRVKNPDKGIYIKNGRKICL